jgi:hypothetical protein
MPYAPDAHHLLDRSNTTARAIRSHSVRLSDRRDTATLDRLWDRAVGELALVKYGIADG